MTKEELYETIKNRIIAQEFKPEQVLNEKELIKTFNVGRTPLREVLFDLQRDGLVNVLPRYGTIVTPLSLDDLRNLAQLRPTLEELVVDILNEHIKQEQLDEIKKLLEKADAIMLTYKDQPLPESTLTELRNLEAKVHIAMYNSTENPYLISVCRKLQANCERYWCYAKMDTNQIIDQVHDIKQVYNALHARDKERCKYLMRMHSINYIQCVLSSLAKVK